MSRAKLPMWVSGSRCAEYGRYSIYPIVISMFRKPFGLDAVFTYSADRSSEVFPMTTKQDEQVLRKERNHNFSDVGYICINIYSVIWNSLS